MNRRDFLLASGLGVAGGALAMAAGCRPNRDQVEDSVSLRPGLRRATAGDYGDARAAETFEELRAGLLLDPDFIHLAGMLIVSHPRDVREAVKSYRESLDVDNALFVRANRRNNEHRVRGAAARYLGARPQEIAVTPNTTSGLGLVYAGIKIREDQAFLTTRHDYYSTLASLDFQSRRSGAAVRRVTLYDQSEDAEAEEMIGRLMEAVEPKTRVVGLTWVHSSTGVKIPVTGIASAIQTENASRAPENRIIVVVDAAHGLGVEDVGVNDLGCDVYVAGTHKWLLAPRGTGIVWGHPRAHDQISPTIPTFTRRYGWGGDMTPGGYHAFEHQWAAADAFELHLRLGRFAVQERIHGHAQFLKTALAKMGHVTVRTPMDQSVSAGVVCFDVRGMQPRQTVNALHRRGIISTVTPAPPYHARFSPGMFNTREELERVVEAVDDLA